MALEIVPLDFAEANELVRRWHRHHRPVPGMKFAVGASKNGEVVGAAIVSRPTARMSDDGWTLEVTRCVTDGTKNACSALYGACARATFALGFKKLITYTLPTESGSSLRGAGWKCLGEAGGGRWSRKARPRVDLHPLQKKTEMGDCDIMITGLLAFMFFGGVLVGWHWREIMWKLGYKKMTGR